MLLFTDKVTKGTENLALLMWNDISDTTQSFDHEKSNLNSQLIKGKSINLKKPFVPKNVK